MHELERAAAFRAGGSSSDAELRWWRARAEQLEYLLECAIGGLDLAERADRMNVRGQIERQRFLLPTPDPEPAIVKAMDRVRRWQSAYMRRLERTHGIL